jgi:hypothetical protein
VQPSPAPPHPLPFPPAPPDSMEGTTPDSPLAQAPQGIRHRVLQPQPPHLLHDLLRQDNPVRSLLLPVDPSVTPRRDVPETGDLPPPRREPLPRRAQLSWEKRRRSDGCLRRRRVVHKHGARGKLARPAVRVLLELELGRVGETGDVEDRSVQRRRRVEGARCPGRAEKGKGHGVRKRRGG